MEIPNQISFIARIQVRKAKLRFVLALYAPAILILLGIGVAIFYFDVPGGRLTRDPAAITSTPLWTGLLSNLGIVLWSFTVGITLFTALVLRYSKRNDQMMWFLATTGLGTAVIMADDLFLLHESVFPYYLGIPEKITFVIYGVGFLIIAYRFRSAVSDTPVALGLLATGLLISSAIADAALEGVKSAQLYSHFVEDGLKFLGIVGWLAYLSFSCYEQLSPRVGAVSMPPEGVRDT